jgi:hypothetical protein
VKQPNVVANQSMQLRLMKKGMDIWMLNTGVDVLTNGGSDSCVTKAWMSRCNLSETDELMD